MSILTYRSWAQWMLGYPEAARRDAEQALTYAREPGQAAALLYTAAAIPLTHIFCGDYAAANAQADAVVALADEKGTLFWKAMGIMDQGCVLAMTGHRGRNPHDCLRNHRVAVSWRNSIIAVLLILSCKGPRGAWSIR